MAVVAWYGLAPDAAASSWAEQRVAETQSEERSFDGAGAGQPEMVTVSAVSGGGKSRA